MKNMKESHQIVLVLVVGLVIGYVGKTVYDRKSSKMVSSFLGSDDVKAQVKY